jgi:hypothetical protein
MYTTAIYQALALLLILLAITIGILVWGLRTLNRYFKEEEIKDDEDN